MNVTLVALAVWLGLVALLLAATEAGFRLGTRRLRLTPDDAAASGAVEAVVFALLGLLVAFTFGAAASRFDARRHLILQEANAIGTAYLRFDLLPPADRDALRALAREYLDHRLSMHGRDRTLAEPGALQRMSALQQAIWARAMEATSRAQPATVTPLVVGSVNEMFDVATSRIVAARTRAPLLLLALLVALSTMAAVMIGMHMSAKGRRSVVHGVIFAVAMSMTLCVIFDLELPRVGLIRVSSADQVLIDLRAGMNERAVPPSPLEPGR